MRPRRRSQVVRRLTATLALLLTPLGVLAPTAAVQGPQAASAPGVVPLPQDDPFYGAVPGIGRMSNGAIIRSRPIDAALSFFGAKVGATSWQIAFKSLSATDRPIVGVVTLVVPTAPWKHGGQRPVVAYQGAEDSTGLQCAPSYALRSGNGVLTGTEQAIMTSALNRGFALAVTDHEGPDSAFMSGPQAAHVILDSLRAVQAFSPAGMSSADPLGMWEFSGAGDATAWAAEQAASYAPELEIAGAAIGGASPSLANTLRKLDRGPLTAYAYAGMVGLHNAYPRWNILDYLDTRGLAAYATASDACIADFGTSLAFHHYADDTTVPDILSTPSVAAMLRRNDIGQAAPSMPVHLYYTPLDEAVPAQDNQVLINRYCAGGARVDVDVQVLADHISLGATGSGPALDFLRDRFAGRPAPSVCPR